MRSKLFIGQGRKVGPGGHLMGEKVNEQVRDAPCAVSTSAAARRPDWGGLQRPRRGAGDPREVMTTRC